MVSSPNEPWHMTAPKICGQCKMKDDAVSSCCAMSPRNCRQQAEEHHHNHKTSTGAERAIEFDTVCIHVRTNSVSISCMSLSVAVVVSVYVSLSVEV